MELLLNWGAIEGQAQPKRVSPRALKAPPPGNLFPLLSAGSGSSAAATASSTCSSQTSSISLRVSSPISSASFLVARRQHDALDAGRACRGDDLLLDAADRQHQPAQADLAGHGGVAAHRALGEQRDTSAMNMATPALGPSLGMAPAGTWMWMSLFSNTAGSMPSDAARFLTMLSAACALSFMTSPSWPVRISLPLPGNARRLDEQDVAADRRPGEPRRHARHARAHRHLVLELLRAKHDRELVHRDADRTTLALGDAHRGMAQHLADLALETAHAGLARVVRDDDAQRLVGDLDLLGLQAVGLELAAHQIAPRDLELLVGRVARELMISMRSRSGPGMVSSMFAVVMNTTRLRSNGTPR